MPEHGTRAHYRQLGCRCLPCRAANASYQAWRRHQHQIQKIPLGSRVAAEETWRLVQWLLKEGVARQELARALGYVRSRTIRLCRGQISLRNVLKIRRIARRYLAPR